MHLPLYKIEISGIIIIVRCASVAQSVEQGTENPRVIGSIPIGGTSQETQQGFQYAAVAHLVERHLAKVEVASSSLVGRSIMEQQSLFQYGPVAQLVRAPACHAGGRRFEPDPGRSSKVLLFIVQSCKQDCCDECQTFSSSPQNLASQAFAGTPKFERIAREGARVNAPNMRP